MCVAVTEWMEKWLHNDTLHFHATLCKHSVRADEDSLTSGCQTVESETDGMMYWIWLIIIWSLGGFGWQLCFRSRHTSAVQTGWSTKHFDMRNSTCRENEPCTKPTVCSTNENKLQLHSSSLYKHNNAVRSVVICIFNFFHVYNDSKGAV